VPATKEEVLESLDYTAIKNAKITIPIGTYLSKLSESVFKIFSIILLVIKSPTVV